MIFLKLITGFIFWNKTKTKLNKNLPRQTKQKIKLNQVKTSPRRYVLDMEKYKYWSQIRLTLNFSP